MKKVTLLFAALLLVTTVTACGKKGPIIGKWEIIEATGTMAALNKGTTYEFKTDGTLIMKKGFENKAKYTLEGDNLTYTVGTVTMKSTVKISGNTMTMKIANSDQVFTLKKK